MNGLTVFPLSAAQQRFWLVEQLDGSEGQYVIRVALRLRGELDGSAFLAAVRGLVNRHEALRTVFLAKAGNPVQVVLPRSTVDVARTQAQGSSEAELLADAMRRAADTAARPFDLARGPLLRVELIRLAAQDHVCAFAVHHIVADQWSLGVLLTDLAEGYAAAVAGRAVTLPVPAIGYGDYAAWEQQRLAGPDTERALAYWRENLADAPPALRLPPDDPRPPAGPAGTSFALDAAPVATLSHRYGVSPFTVLVAAFSRVFAAQTGTEDVVLSTALATRDRQTESVVGCFVNEVLVRTDLRGDPTFGEVLRRAANAVNGAIDHRELPFDRLVAELRPHRDGTPNPFTGIGVVLQTAPLPALGLTGLEVSTLPVPPGASQLDIDIALWLEGEGYAGTIAFAADRFDAARIERLPDQVRTVLAAAAHDPERPISDLPALTVAEHRLVVGDLSGASATSPDALGTVCARFDEQALATPDATALVDPETGQSRSYARLRADVDRLARRLRAAGAGSGTPVGVCLRPGPALITALLAVLRTGSHYVPLDPDHPEPHRAFLVRDSGTDIALATGEHAPALPVRTILDPTLDEGPHAADPGDQPDPDALAYLLYTSGSTGIPKGVGITHRALATRVAAAIDTWQLTEQDRVLQFNSINFDASVEDVFPCLAAGAALVLPPRRLIDPALLSEHVRRDRITVLNLPTAYWHQWVDASVSGERRLPEPLRLMVIGGEEADAARVDAWLRVERRVPLLNCYGPTETTVTATLADLTRVPAARGVVPIGRPIADAETYLLDGRLRPVPLGAVGELYVGGAGLARDYHGLPSATAERFLPHPFTDNAGARLYATGDLARYRPDGNLEFLGRRDDQVKVRGFRVEPGQVVLALRGHPGVADAAVLPRATAEGTRQLVAYWVAADAGLTSTELGRYLRATLPEYLRPAALVALDRLPLLPTGKLDRDALPEVSAETDEQGAIAPRNATEAEIASLWAELLERPVNDVHGDFFHLGGHSLLATRLAARLRDRFAVELPLGVLFDHSTIAGQAEHVAHATRPTASLPPVTHLPASGPGPLTTAQRRMWLFDQLEPDGAVYTIAMAARLAGPLDENALRSALRATLLRHEALRSTYPVVDGEPAQVVLSDVDCGVRLVDLSGRPDQESRCEELLAELARHRFDIATDPPIRVVLARLAPELHVLGIAVHHIAVDGWSLHLVLGDLVAHYHQVRTGAAAITPTDVARWEESAEVGLAHEEQLAYWREQLAVPPPALRLPADRVAAQEAQAAHPGARRTAVVDPATTTRLRELASRSSASLFMVLLSGFDVLLGRLCQSEDVVVGVPVAGRTRPELESVVGCLLNTVLVRTDLRGDPDVAQLLARVRSSVLGAFDHQDVPFERVAELVAAHRDAAGQAPFPVLFALQNEPSAVPVLDDLRVELLDVPLADVHVELSCVVTEQDEGLSVSFEYATDRFDPATVDEFLAGYLTLLTELVLDPARPVARLSQLDSGRRARALLDWNATARPLPADGDLLGLIWSRALADPDAVAVDDGRERLTYQELFQRADDLAAVLRGFGADRERVVGLSLRPSAALVVAAIAVLRAGAAFLPLDVTLPMQRRGLMVADSSAILLITEPALADATRAAADGAPVLVLDADLPAAEPLGQPSVDPDALACVFYTSGSTNVPKGVMFDHRGLVNYTLAMVEEFGLTPGDRFLQLASIGFDVLLEEVFPALAAGATIVFPTPGWTLDSGGALAGQITATGATVLELTTAYWHEWVYELRQAGSPPPESLRLVAVGGERILPERLAQWQEFGVELINVYGLTEACVTSTVHDLTMPADLARALVEVPIGHPIANTTVYVLDRAGSPAPVGVPGELYVGGYGVTRGYLGRPGQTARRFVPDPFADRPGARLYRTGDLARYRADGSVEFLGRGDHQVKLRGYRIELGEVETALAEPTEVREAVAIVREDRPGDRRLVGYVAADGLLDLGALRAGLARRLPGYMVPAAVVVLPALPMNANGKLDRAQLPAPEHDDLTDQRPFVPPATPVERELAQLCAEVLGVPAVGMADNFLSLGGHSLLAVRLVTQIRARLGAEVSLRAVFEAENLAALALEVLQRRSESVDADELACLLDEIEAAGSATDDEEEWESDARR